MTVTIASRYNHHGVDKPLDCSESPSLTKQEFKDECDIDRIMKRHSQGQELPAEARVALYGDFSEVGDYVQAQEILLHARAQFDALPATVRERFGNDPSAFLTFVGDPSNKDELRKLGLVNPPPEAPKPTLIEFAPGELAKIESLKLNPDTKK